MSAPFETGPAAPFIASRSIPHEDDSTRRVAATGTVRDGATTTDLGSCWCHGQHGLSVPADSLDGLCASCRSRSPSACKTAHGREAAS